MEDGLRWGRRGEDSTRNLRTLLGGLAYRSGPLKDALVERGVLLATERTDRRPALRQQVEVCFAMLKCASGLGEALAKATVGLATRIALKVTAYTYGCYANRIPGRPQGRVKDLWA